MFAVVARTGCYARAVLAPVNMFAAAALMLCCHPGTVCTNATYFRGTTLALVDGSQHSRTNFCFHGAMLVLVNMFAVVARTLLSWCHTHIT